MKKLSTLFTLLLFSVLSMTAQTWNFATLSNDDKTDSCRQQETLDDDK